MYRFTYLPLFASSGYILVLLQQNLLWRLEPEPENFWIIYSFGVHLKREQLPLSGSWWREKYTGITQINTVIYHLVILSTLIFPSLLFAIMFTILLIFISILFFFYLEKTSQMQFSLVSVLLFNILKAI